MKNSAQFMKILKEAHKSCPECATIYEQELCKYGLISPADIPKILDGTSCLLLDVNVLFTLYRVLHEHKLIRNKADEFFSKVEIAAGVDYAPVQIQTISEAYNDFYNNDMKNAFLKTLENEQVLMYMQIFSTISICEHLKNKDVSDFSLRDLVILFNQCEWVMPATFQARKSLISNYIAWTKTDNDAIYQIDLTKVNVTLRLENAFFSSVQEMANCIQTVLEQDDCPQPTIDRLSVFFALIWYGMSREVICLIRKKDLDIE